MDGGGQTHGTGETPTASARAHLTLAAPAPALPVAASASASLPGSAWAWAGFEGFRNPAVVLITIYVFMPYFVARVAPDPVSGQALVAQGAQIAGWLVAITAPLLGVAVDRMGPRKPALTLTIMLMAPLYWAMWFITRDGPIGLTLVVAIAALKSVFFAWTEVLHNALLVPAARGQTARTSGLGLALGNAASVMMLVAVMWAFALPGQVDWAWVPAQPLFGLDQASHEPARIVGPIVAVSLLCGLALILWGVPDVAPTGARIGAAIRGGLADLRALIGQLKTEREAAKFLLARMLYADGKTAILIFGGVLAAGVMGWGTLEMLAYGIIMSVLAVGGGILGGRLDVALGPKRALMLEIGGTALVLMALLFSRPDRILGIPVSTDPLFDGPMFTTPAELAYIAIAGLSAITITAAYALSRTMLTTLVPPDRVGTFFGLYALSGTATMWLGPLLVAVGTTATGSQQGGFAMVLILLLSGLGVLTTVKAPLR